MTLAELIHLYILQKDHHEKNEHPHAPDDADCNNDEADRFKPEYDRLTRNLAIQASEQFAPGKYEYVEQPAIPYTLLKPMALMKDGERYPLIIHTHGGPGVYFSTEQKHAEIAYFLSKGFVVACPNYRGSAGDALDYQLGYYRVFFEAGDGKEEHQKLQILQNLSEESMGKHHVYGPQDIVTVTEHLLTQDYIDADRVYLRGGSFGSHINSHLVAGITEGKYPNLYKGVHLSGGVKYPLPKHMNIDIPMLITHAVNDDVAPFDEADLFMQRGITTSHGGF